MAAHALKLFSKTKTLLPAVARESTKLDRNNAIVLLQKLSPSTEVYSTDHCICAFGGFLAILWEDVATHNFAMYSDLRFHLSENKKIPIRVKLEETLELQKHILLACGHDFALQYSADCLKHHGKNSFVSALHEKILETTCMSRRIATLAGIGTQRTRYALRMCARAFAKNSRTKKTVESLLEQQCLHLQMQRHAFFVRVWESVHKAMGCSCMTVKNTQFKQSITKYSPKVLYTGENVKLYHPDDFDRILLLVTMHKAWIDGKSHKQYAPKLVQSLWENLGI